ncbi:hypothetical protein B0H14DRAFT_3469417 [Mycena olivaceomarginata]|nr:hypothetical protein B0H14DRAFT_3469417 [Mycena olivaceomarginata]
MLTTNSCRLLNRCNGSHPYLTELRNHRRHVGDDPDEETTRPLLGQWRFDTDYTLFGPPEEVNREPVDEYDSRYLMGRMAWSTRAEAALVTDASLIVQRPDGREMRVLPEQFLANAIHMQEIYEKPIAYLMEEGIIPTFALGPPRISSPAVIRGTPAQQKAATTSASPHPSLHPRPQIMLGLVVPRASLYHWKRLLEEIGSTTRPPSPLRDRPRIITQAVLSACLDMYQKEPDVYLDGLRWHLGIHYDIAISTSALQKDLAGLTRKLLHRIARERTRQQCDDY